MELKLYDSEILISSENDDDSEKLNSFFLRNHTSKIHKADAYKAKVEIIKSNTGNHMTISISFI